MKTFLSLKILVFLLFAVSILPCSAQKENLTVFDYWPYYGDMSCSLYQQICARAFEQTDARKSAVEKLTTKVDWERRQAEIKKTLADIVGPFPERTPLNPVITGKIDRPDFTVEKLYFESRPGYHVTAALYVPKAGKGKKPAILYCCGHSADGFRAAAYQKAAVNYVKKGFVVLAFDPIGQGERLQYLDDAGKSFFNNPCHEHSYPGSQSFLSGLSPANYFIWDGIRAVDYLVSRKEVDPKRIGVTGRSGGGTQSAYIMAMDDRIAAAAPECYITSFEMLLRSKGPQDAEQNFMHSLARGFDIADLIEVRAPRPTLMITTTRDIFSIQGARDVFHEAQKAYAALGMPENIKMAEDDTVHASTRKNREAAYAFFRKHLDNPGSAEDLDVEIFDVKDLRVTPKGQLQGFIATKTMFDLNKEYTEAVIADLNAKRKSNDDYLKNLKDRVITALDYREPPLPKKSIFSGRLWREGYSIEKYLLKGAGDDFISLLRLVPVGGIRGTVLLFDDNGKVSAVAPGGVADRAVKAGYQVIVPDLSGAGEAKAALQDGDALIQGTELNIWYGGILTRRAPLTIRAEEIAIVLDFANRLDPSSGRIIGAACGTFSSELLHAAVINNSRFDRIALINPLLSYRSLVFEKNYRTKFIMSSVAGMIAQYDIPDLLAATSAQSVAIINPVGALDKPLYQTGFDAICQDTPLQKDIRNGKTKVRLQCADIPTEFIDWLK